MPPPVTKTIAEIKETLDSEGKGLWLPLNDYYGLVVVSVDGPIINFLEGKKGMVLKAFFNTETAEIRTFVAKNLDVPDREKLWR